MNYQEKKCVVLGLGRSGLAAARLLAREGAIVSVVDSNTDEAMQKKAELLRLEKISVHLGAAAENDSTVYDFAVLSPGIETTVSLVTNVTQKGIPLVGELELAYSCCPLPIVAITGTNGKTTTTELTTKALQGAGLRAIACGNIGLPFSEAVLQSDQLDVFVVEVSSFQLEGIEKFHPHVAVWLNLSPNHLDRYHSMEEYRAAKLRIFKNLSLHSTQAAKNSVAPVLDLSNASDALSICAPSTSCSSSVSAYVKIDSENQYAGDFAVIPVSFDRTATTIKAHCLTFSTTRQDGDFSFHDDFLFYQGSPFLNIKETRLRGLHNVENLMAAFAVGVALKQPLNLMAEAVKDYTPPAHRCEWVAENKGVIWINDSKSTTLDAMEKALLSIEKSRPIILIAGGKNKGSSFKPLLSLIQERVKVAILIGELKDSIASEWKTIPCHQADSMEEAVAMARATAVSGDTILLSPGTSSYDMFSNYQERGDCFKKAVHQLITH